MILFIQTRFSAIGSLLSGPAFRNVRISHRAVVGLRLAGFCLWLIGTTQAQTISTVAGNYGEGFSGDGGSATAASLYYPYGVAVDGSGNLFIADQINNRIRQVTPGGVISTVAGNGNADFSGDGGSATAASLKYPSGVAVDGSGNLFIADQANNRIRKVTPGGVISTVAGNGNADFSGDGGSATAASLNSPSGVAVDGSGNLFIADQANNRIRKVTPGGVISTVAGNGSPNFSGDGGTATSASLYSPSGVAVDGSGNLFIADQANNRIRKVTPGGVISTVAGNGRPNFSGDGGTATSASLYYPTGVAVNGSGNLFIADQYNDRIRKVTPTGIISTVAGNGNADFSGDGGSATAASLNYPAGVAVDGSGNLFIADQYNDRIRKVILNTAPTVATAIPNQSASVGQPFSYTLPANAFTDAETPNSLTYTASIVPSNGLTYASNTRIISGTPLASGVSSVTVVATDPGSLTASQVFSITTTCPALTASIGGSRTVCQGQNTTLTASGGDSYRWSTGATTASISATAGTYSVTVITSGCSATATATVTANPAVVATLTASPSTTLSCAVTSLTLTASGGGSYRFSSGASQVNGGNTATVNTAGTYSVTVTSANGCSAVAQTTVTGDQSVPTASLTNNGPLTCSMSSVTLTASGGGSYRFSRGATQLGISNQATVSESGTYSVTVTSANGCSATAQTTVTGDQSVPTASLTNNGPLTCSMSSVTLTASGGGSYRFSRGATQLGISNQATVSESGTYSVTVTSANGCSALAQTTVVGDQSVPTAGLTNNGPLSCSTTSVTLTASGGGSYRFSLGATQLGSSNQATVSSSGTYSVTVTSANGCSATAQTTVTGDQSVPTAGLTNNGPLSCSTTSVTLTASGGGSYRFSRGATQLGISNQATVSESGTYSVTVTSANGCSALAQTTVVGDQSVPTAGLTNNGPLSCSTTSVTLTASGGGSYRFSSGASQVNGGNTATVNTAGTYSVTVTSANGCSAVAQTTVTGDQSVPTAGLTNNGPLSCSTTSVTLTASGGGSYRFSRGATQLGISNQATVSESGTYSVTVTSANGCSALAQTTVVGDQSVPTAGLTNNGPLSCSTTSVTLTASGGGSYRFSLGATQLGSSNQATVSSSGTYSVTVTSANGCSATAQTTVTGDQSVPTAGLTNNGPLSCSTTSVTLTASGGGSYRFSRGATQLGISNQATVSESGTYSVTVTSANGCSATAQTTVTGDQSVPTAGLTNNGPLSCSTTSVTLTASGGGSYRFSSGATQVNGGNTATVNTAGTYSVTVTSANGCSAVAQTTVTGDQSVPTASLTNNGPLSCSTTSVTLSASGGGSYRFSSGASQVNGGNTATVNTAGTYSVTVTSANGCSATAQTTVTGDQSVPTVSITANPSLTISQGQAATLTAQGAASYNWSTGANASSIVVSAAGPYSVTGTSGNGCQGVASVTLTVNAVASGPFAITGVTTVSCTPVGPGRFSLSFDPRYSGRDGSPLSFSVTNELLPTAQPGPYTLQVYTDNPTLTLEAAQGSATTRYAYRWLEACRVTPGPNTPPRVVSPIPSQTATVGQYFSYVIPGSTFTDDQTPNGLQLSASGLPPGLSFGDATLSGTPSSTVGSPYSVTITATDPGGLWASTTLTLSVQPAGSTPPPPPPPTGPFSITGVTTISCTPVANRINIVYQPRYAGMNGQPIAFEAVNESLPTTEPGPYSLSLYRDNPVITLRATQTGSAGPASFAYRWLEACASAGQDNTPPRLNSPVANQTAVVGQGYSLNLSNTFTDQETPDQLSLSASGLPAGLSLTGKQISGTPSQTGVSAVTLTATDGGGLSSSTSFTLTVVPAGNQPPTPPTPPTTGTFSITGVTTLSCEVLSGGERRLTFSPRYSGLDGSPVSFSVVNELRSTTSAGPYVLKLYTDNPVITLVARQSGVNSSYSYPWLAGCSSANSRTAAKEQPLRVIVLGNPVREATARVLVQGEAGQPVELEVRDEQGHWVSGIDGVLTSGGTAFPVGLGASGGSYYLRVSSAGQHQLLKLIKY